MGMTNFINSVITADGQELVRRAREKEEKIYFIGAVTSNEYENNRVDLCYKPKSFFNGITGQTLGVMCDDGVVKVAVGFFAGDEVYHIKSIGLLAVLESAEGPDEAIIFAAASDDNSQMIIPQNSDDGSGGKDDGGMVPVISPDGGKGGKDDGPIPIQPVTPAPVASFVFDLPISLSDSEVHTMGSIPGTGGGSGGDTSEFVTYSELSYTLANYVTSTALSNTLSGYATTDSMSDFVTTNSAQNISAKKTFIGSGAESNYIKLEIDTDKTDGGIIATQYDSSVPVVSKLCGTSMSVSKTVSGQLQSTTLTHDRLAISKPTTSYPNTIQTTFTHDSIEVYGRKASDGSFITYQFSHSAHPMSISAGDDYVEFTTGNGAKIRINSISVTKTAAP